MTDIWGSILQHRGHSDLDGAYGSLGVVLVQVVDVSWQRNAEEVVLLPQAAQLLVVHVRAHFEGGHGRTCADIPEFHGLVPWGRDQLSAVGAPADLENKTRRTAEIYFLCPPASVHTRGMYVHRWDISQPDKTSKVWVMVFTGALKAAQTAHLCHTEKILAQMTLGKKNNNNTHSIDSSIVGFLSTQRTNFLTSTSITNKYLEMTPRICVIFRCISCVFGPKSTEPKYPADSLLTWPSALAVTNRLPSGEKRTQLTNWLCSF